MIPQKFLRIKCFRFLLILHVVGIVFFAYKLYNSFGASPPVPEGPKRSIVTWSIKPNHSATSTSRHDVNDSGEDTDGNDEDVDEYDEDIDEDSATSEAANGKPVKGGSDTDLLKDSAEEDDDNVEDDNGEDDYDYGKDDSEEDDYDYDKDDNGENDYDHGKDETQHVDKGILEKPEDYDGPYFVDIGINKNSEKKIKYSETIQSPKLTQPPKIKPTQYSPSFVANLRRNHWTISNAGKYSKSLFAPPPGEKAIQRLPQVIVIGSPNSGVRPLLDFLEIHPQIVAIKRELPFFDNQNVFQMFTNLFLSLMPFSYSNQVTVGRTRFSHWTEDEVCNMYLRRKSLKIIIVLRDPVLRILSQVTSSRSGESAPLTVSQHGRVLKVNNDTETVDWGRYVQYVKMWTQCFPKSQIHVAEWSDIIQHPAQTVRNIETFLGVQHVIRENNYYRDEAKRAYCIRPLHEKTTVCLSENKGKNPILSPEEVALIYQFYIKHNEDLFRLLGQRYEWEPRDS